VLTEVEFALSTGHKAVIPVSIHRSYAMDGWLSAALIGHCIISFADSIGGSQDEFDTGMMQLLQRLSVITGVAPLSVNTTDNAGLGKTYCYG